MMQKYKIFSLMSNPTWNYDTEMTFMNAVISQKELDFLYETTLDGLSNNLVKTMLKNGLFYEKQISQS